MKFLIKSILVLIALALFGIFSMYYAIFNGTEVIKEIWYKYRYAPIFEEHAGEWVEIKPGKPNETFPTPVFSKKGTGEQIQIGDFIFLKKTWHETIDGKQVLMELPTWLWLSFLTPKTTTFYSAESRMNFQLDSALIGMPTGSEFHFSKNQQDIDNYKDVNFYFDKNKINDSSNDFIGHIFSRNYQYFPGRRIEIDSLSNYLQYQFHTFNSKYYIDHFVKNINSPPYFIYSMNANEIKNTTYLIEKRCPAKLQKREIKWTYTQPVYSQGRLETEPRSYWVEEAAISAQCSDGTTVAIKYALDNTNPVRYEGRGSHDWSQDVRRESAKTPLGIQITPEPKM